MKVIKKINKCISPHINHLINNIIYFSTYPDCLKLSRMTPNLKPQKKHECIDSYRPLNNLNALDKLIQQYIKEEFQNYLDINNIIVEQHHGSRKHFSTMTALAEIINKLKNNYSNNLHTASICNNLQAIGESHFLWLYNKCGADWIQSDWLHCCNEIKGDK